MQLTDAKAYIIVAIITLAGTIFSVVWATSAASDGRDDLKDTIGQLNATNKEMQTAINALNVEVAFLRGIVVTNKQAHRPPMKLDLPEISIRTQKPLELGQMEATAVVAK